MLRRISALLLVLLFAASAALAERYDEPVLKNPRDRYEAYMEKTDGSDALVMMMLDAMNDEAALVEENGPLTASMRHMDANGEVMDSDYVTLMNCEYGRILVISSGFTSYDAHVYIIGEEALMEDGGIFETMESGTNTEELEVLWGCYVYPFADFKMMHGMRQDENGYSYMLLRDAAGDLYEHVLGEGMKILEIRQYTPDENGDMVYKMRVTFSHDSDWEVPEEVLARMAENVKDSSKKNK